MTREEILAKAKYVILPNGKHYDVENALMLPSGEQYVGWSMNAHHYTTKYHREVLFPALETLLNFKMDESKYHLVERHSGNFDISFLAPNDKMLFSGECFNDGIVTDNMTFDDLTLSTYDTYDITDYHKLFKYGHKTCKVENLSHNNGRRLYISCDSQMIPSAALLCTIFKEVWHIDNRWSVNVYSHLKDVFFDDVLFVLNWDPIDKYTIKNLQ